MSKILFAASEGLPFIKTGGLADVVASLPQELSKRGHDVRVVLPLYREIILKHYDELERIGTFRVHSGWIDQPATYYSAKVGEVTYYFIEHQGYFERDTLYGYPDDGARFAFFQRSLLEMFHVLDWFPDLIQSNDWQTGMVPLMCHACFQSDERYQRIKHVFTIHNLAFQGNFPAEMLPSCLGLPYYYYDNGSVRFDTGISFLKSGIVYADKIATVSPSYSAEILTATYGERMDAILRYRREDLWGIVNGIDTELWNPTTDQLLAKNYNLRNWRSGKKENKTALQEELGLEVDPNVCVIGLVSRLTKQKGVYLLTEKMQELMEENVQLVILGTGEEDAENAFRWLESRYKGKAVFYRGYNEELAHRIYAGSDLFLMPSLYEPCGISQLISQRYGTLPLVRETGGLRDTVQPYNQYTGEGNGFSFGSADASDMMHVIRYALGQYYDNRSAWQGLVKSAMKTDVSWANSAAKYDELYELCLNRE